MQKTPSQAISEVREEADQHILHTITHLVTCQWLKTTPIIPSVACYITTSHARTLRRGVYRSLKKSLQRTFVFIIP